MFDVAENKKISNNIPVMAGEWTNKRLACLQFSAWRALYFPFVQRQFYLSLSLSSFLCLSLSNFPPEIFSLPNKQRHCWRIAVLFGTPIDLRDELVPIKHIQNPKNVCCVTFCSFLSSSAGGTTGPSPPP